MKTPQSEKIRGRVIVVGDHGVGKTSLLNRIINDSFNEEHVETTSVNSFFFQDEIYELEFLDTPGDCRYNELLREYYGESIAQLIVLDRNATSSDVHAQINTFLSEFTEFATKINIILVANKIDLLEADPFSSGAFSHEDINIDGNSVKLSLEPGHVVDVTYVEVSFRESTNVRDLRNKILELAANQHKILEPATNQNSLFTRSVALLAFEFLVNLLLNVLVFAFFFITLPVMCITRKNWFANNSNKRGNSFKFWEKSGDFQNSVQESTNDQQVLNDGLGLQIPITYATDV